MDFHSISLYDIIVMLVTGGAVYGAIRADIKGIHEKIARTEKSVDEAHKRIDNLLMHPIK